MKKVGLIYGSLRKNSMSERWARNLIGLYPEGFSAEIVDISELPFYNQDFDRPELLPQEVKDFREKISQLDAVVFITSEYNRSVPPALKNAIDTASRPYTNNLWDLMPALVISHAFSKIGGFGAHHHLRQSLVCLNIPVVAQPEVYLEDKPAWFDKEGKLIEESVVGFLQSAVDAHVMWINKWTS